MIIIKVIKPVMVDQEWFSGVVIWSSTIVFLGYTPIVGVLIQYNFRRYKTV